MKTWLKQDPLDRPTERAAIRVLVPVAFLSTVAIAVLIAANTQRAPGIAFNNHLVYGGFLSLVLFYGLLLLVLPVIHAVLAGELPTELTTTGARYADPDALKGSLVANQKLQRRIEKLDASVVELRDRASSSTDDLLDAIAALNKEVDDLRQKIGRSGN